MTPKFVTIMSVERKKVSPKTWAKVTKDIFDLRKKKDIKIKVKKEKNRDLTLIHDSKYNERVEEYLNSIYKKKRRK